MNARTQILRRFVGAFLLPLWAAVPSALAAPDLAFSEVRILDQPPETPVGNRAIGVAIGDLNADSTDDVVIVAAGRGRVVFGDPVSELGEPIAFEQNLTLTFYDLELADINRDGHLDLLIAGTGAAQTILVHLNDGAGNLAPAISTGISGAHVEVADMNADGFADIVTRGASFIEIHISTGPLAFALPIATPLTGILMDVSRVSVDPFPDILASNALFVSTLALGFGTVHNIDYSLSEADALVDLTGDGFAEVLVTGRDYSFQFFTSFYVLTYAGGVLSETLATTVPVSSPAGVTPLDCDNDGDLDLAFTTIYRDATIPSVTSDMPPVTAAVFNNDGAGNLAFDRSMPTGGIIGASLAAGQLDGVPGDDLVVASTGLNVIFVPSQEAQFFGRAVALLETDEPAAAAPQQVANFFFNNGLATAAALVDVNIDGILDLAVVHLTTLNVRLARAPGVYDERYILPSVGPQVSGLIVEDVTGDGIDDLVVTNSLSPVQYSRVELQSVTIPPPMYADQRIRYLNLDPDTRLSREGSQYLNDLDNDSDNDWISYTSSISQNTSTLLIDRRDNGTWVRSTQVVPGRIRRIALHQSSSGVPDLLLYRSVDTATDGYNDWRFELLPNDGQGNFGEPVLLLQSASEIVGMVQGDFAGDAATDVVITTDDGMVRTFIADGPGFLAPVTSSIAPWIVYQPAVADFNLDGELDLAGPVSQGNKFLDTDTQSRFLLGNGTGGFPRIVSAARHVVPPVFGVSFDYNNDAKPDYIALNYFGGVTLYPNLSVPLDCAADANGDLVIDGRDLSLLLSTFGDTSVPGRGADLNADGTIDGADLAVLLAQFGTSCK